MSGPGKLLIGPWRGPAPRLEGQAFEALSDDQQRATLAYALYDVGRYWSDLSPNEQGWLRLYLPTGRPVRLEALTAEQRARLAGVVLLVLQRRAGWAA